MRNKMALFSHFEIVNFYSYIGFPSWALVTHIQAHRLLQFLHAH